MSPPRRLTRREALGSAAAIGTASLIGPPGALAAPRPLSTRWIGSLHGVSAAVAAGRPFSLVGVEWATTAAHVHIELRARGRDGAWSDWVSASALGHGPDGAAERRSRFGEPVWTGPAEVVQLRSAGPVGGVRVHFVTPRASAYEPRAASGYPLAGPALPAGPGQPAIIARAAWARGQAPPAVPPAYGNVKLAFVHHSETPNGYSAAEVPAMLTSIFDYHRFVQGWHDIGYNFAVDTFGRIWEARAGGIGLPVIGAQAGGYNAVSTGVVVLGSFSSVAPSGAALSALERLLAWKLSLHGVIGRGRVTVRVNPSDAYYTPFAAGQLVSLPRIAGHRDGDSTNCPGDALYALLPAVRSRAIALAGTPVRLSLKAPPTAVAGAPITLSGRLASLGGAPLAGAAIEVQRLAPAGPVTFIEVTTSGDGTWAASVAPIHNVVLGALHRAGPAAVAPPASVAVAPAVTLTLDATSPLRVSGSVVPAKGRVTIELYRMAGGRRRLIRQTAIGVSRGAFTVTLRSPGPGRYVLRAVTAPDARNAAGSSADVPFTF